MPLNRIPSMHHPTFEAANNGEGPIKKESLHLAKRRSPASFSRTELFRSQLSSLSLSEVISRPLRRINKWVFWRKGGLVIDCFWLVRSTSPPPVMSFANCFLAQTKTAPKRHPSLLATSSNWGEGRMSVRHVLFGGKDDRLFGKHSLSPRWPFFPYPPPLKSIAGRWCWFR